MRLAILQARTSSTRLPGKVLAPILGRPMITRIIDRVNRSELVDRLVLVTSTDPTDDLLSQVVAQHGAEVRRGPLEDVLARFEAVRREYEPSVMIRLTGDNALTDPEVIDAVIAGHAGSGCDYTSNTIRRTYPHGLDVECFTSEAFDRMAQLELSPQEREHVTLGMYTRPSDFSIHSVEQARDLSGLRWTVDYPEDLRFVRQVFEQLYLSNPAFTMLDVVELLRDRPWMNRTGQDVS